MAYNKIPKPSDWLIPSNIKLLKNWAVSGLTNEEIAKKIDISNKSFQRWRNGCFIEIKHGRGLGEELVQLVQTPVINNTPTQGEIITIDEYLERNRHLADASVEESLYNAACGGFVVEKTVVKGKVVETERYIPPNIEASKMWLRNRNAKRWRREEREEELNNESVEKIKEMLTAIKARSLQMDEGVDNDV